MPVALIALFVAIAVLMLVDIADDLRGGPSVRHLVLEGAVVVLAAFGSAWLWRRLLAERRAASRARDERLRAEADAARWRAEARTALEGLGTAIDRQLERWDLTPAEREVALMLLKGMSHKEAADARSTAERTVRQQALAIYRKSGLRGRAELSAFFLAGLPGPDPGAR